MASEDAGSASAPGVDADQQSHGDEGENVKHEDRGVLELTLLDDGHFLMRSESLLVFVGSIQRGETKTRVSAVYSAVWRESENEGKDPVRASLSSDAMRLGGLQCVGPRPSTFTRLTF